MAVRCGSCGLELDESEDTAPDDRIPCPNCGSLSRQFEREMEGSITPQGMLKLDLRVFPPTVIQAPPAGASAEGTAPVRPQTYKALRRALEEKGPEHLRALAIDALPDGTFHAAVLDEDGKVVDEGIGDSEDDAILELAEALKRPKEVDP